MTHVIVVGAGNAALCAALSAREHGAEVTVLEKAPEGERGGNTYFTGGGFRFPYDGMQDILRVIPDLSEAEIDRVDVGSYSASDFHSDLARVTDGLIDDGMASTLVREVSAHHRVAAQSGSQVHLDDRPPGQRSGRQTGLLRRTHGRSRRRWQGTLRSGVRSGPTGSA